MKKILSFLLFTSVILTLISPGAAAEEESEAVLNAAAVSAQQLQLCLISELDGMEGEEVTRTPDPGTVLSDSVSAFDGEGCKLLTGNSSVGLTSEIKNAKAEKDCRSVAAAVRIEPGTSELFTVTVTVTAREKTVSGSCAAKAGEWFVVYLPVGSVRVQSVHISVSSEAGAQTRVICSVDCLHTCCVDGMPENLRYFASYFNTYRASLDITYEGMLFTPTGRSARLDSSVCRYMTNGIYNCLAVALTNNSDADELTVKFKFFGESKYNDENTATVPVGDGSGVYYFPISGFRSGTTVESFMLELTGTVRGSILIDRIYFSSYRFPAEYPGSASAAESGSSLVISGSVPSYQISAERICLYRMPVGIDEELPGAYDASEPYRVITEVGDSFSFTVPKVDGGVDNTQQKYVITYEGDRSVMTAAVTYGKSARAAAYTLPYKGLGAPDDASLLATLSAGTVYIDVELSTLFSEPGGEYFEYTEGKRYLSDRLLEKTDALVTRAAQLGCAAVLRLKYTASTDADKYYIMDGDTALPELSTYAGASHFCGLISFFAERYGEKLTAVIPCGKLDGTEISSQRGLGAESAEKYAYEIIRAAAAECAKAGCGIAVASGAEGADAFLDMLRRDVTDPSLIYVVAECNGADEALYFSQTAHKYGFRSAVVSSAGDCARLAELYFGGQGDIDAVCAYLSDAPSLSRLFRVIDTAAGINTADVLCADAYPDGIRSVFPDAVAGTEKYIDRGTLYVHEISGAVKTLFDGSSYEGWSGYDGCKSVYTDTVNAESAVELSFDLGNCGTGYAEYASEPVYASDKIYFKLYADYLQTDGIDVTASVRGENGVITGVCRLEKEKTEVFAMMADSSVGAIRSISLRVYSKDAQTPRICVLGIYTDGSDPEQTVAEKTEITLPDPPTEVFETRSAEIVKNEDKYDSVRLYVIAIAVVISMFALLGGVIFFLKKRGEKKAAQNNEKV